MLAKLDGHSVASRHGLLHFLEALKMWLVAVAPPGTSYRDICKAELRL